jgi:enterochelin esterase-like enzyme
MRSTENGFAFGLEVSLRLTPKRLAAGAVCVAVLALAVVLLASGGGPGPPRAAISPVVRHTGRPPTGYTVTFRYRNRRAREVQIEGEWYFSTPGWTGAGGSQGLLPSQWKPGDFPIGWPNVGTTAAWPVATMREDRRTGVWSYTTPLPSGEFNYGFIVNCSSAELASPNSAPCPEVSDPSNPPWNRSGSVESNSQVYVPSDPTFHTVSYWWEAPASPHGKLRDITYAGTGGPAALPGRNYLAIYTPPGYDPRRPTPYPTLYLSGGATSNEVDWSTRADASNILDNMIDKHVIKPMVVVMPTFFSYCAPSDTVGYDHNLVSRVIPYVQSHYRVAREPSQRAFAGLSCGGTAAASLLADYSRMFGYFGVFSPWSGAGTLGVSARQRSAIEKAGVMVGGGSEDPIHPAAVTNDLDLRQAGVKVFTDFIHGGHDWYVWRIQLHDFLTRVAFLPIAG